MYKLIIELDWASDETLTINSHDFEKLQIIQEFVEFQQEHGWAVDYEAVDNFEDDAEEEASDEVPTFALNAHEPL
jgi:hypothetical protein